MGENAGVVDVGDGWAVTFKIESHNHPSLCRAVPGCGHRRRRHRPRHSDHGRPPGRGYGLVAVRAGQRAGHGPDAARVWWPASVGTETASACRTSAVRSTSIESYSAIRSSMRCASASCAPTGSSSPGLTGAGNRVILFGAKTGAGRHRRRVRARQRHLRRGRRQAAQRPGRRSVRREGAHRVLRGDLRGRSGGWRAGPGRRRAVVCHDGARERRRRRHAHRSGQGSAA